MEIEKAAQKLSLLDFNTSHSGLNINVLWVRPMCLKNGGAIGRHCHSTLELHYAAMGECVVRTDDEEITIKQGEMYITPPGVFHEQIAAYGEHIEYCINADIKKSGNDMEQSLVYNVLSSVQFVVLKDCKRIAELFENIFNEAIRQNLGFYSCIEHYIFLLVNETARLAAPGNLPDYKVARKSKVSSLRFEQIQRYIEDNLSTGVSVGSVADVMYLSEKQINRIVKEEAGCSAKEYILRMKHEKAKEYLKYTVLSIGEIAEMLGFSSTAHFDAFFIKREGYTPLVFRKSIMQ